MFRDAISALSKSAVNKGRLGMLSKQPPKYCDHTSVGVLIYNDNDELLLIERGTFPFGLAAPAGHVDQHASYEEAAIAEAKEEVGLDIRELRLIAEGRRDNPCRRVNGTWHYWKIYEARAKGTVRLSPREVKQAEWCSVSRLVELGMISSERAQASSGTLERVWLDWLLELRVLPPT
jgi:ADP-ribose pyrophosphatase YjhB (NUDIX family)